MTSLAHYRCYFFKVVGLLKKCSWIWHQLDLKLKKKRNIYQKCSLSHCFSRDYIKSIQWSQFGSSLKTCCMGLLHAAQTKFILLFFESCIMTATRFEQSHLLIKHIDFIDWMDMICERTFEWVYLLRQVAPYYEMLVGQTGSKFPFNNTLNK